MHQLGTETLPIHNIAQTSSTHLHEQFDDREGVVSRKQFRLIELLDHKVHKVRTGGSKVVL